MTKKRKKGKARSIQEHWHNGSSTHTQKKVCSHTKRSTVFAVESDFLTSNPSFPALFPTLSITAGSSKLTAALPLHHPLCSLLSGLRCAGLSPAAGRYCHLLLGARSRPPRLRGKVGSGREIQKKGSAK